MCGVSTQQWPSTRITLFGRTCQRAQLDAVTTPVDKKQVNPFVLKRFFFWGSSGTKNLTKDPGNAFSDSDLLLMTCFENFWVAAGAAKTKPSWTLFYGPKILRSCMLHYLTLGSTKLVTQQHTGQLNTAIHTCAWIVWINRVVNIRLVQWLAWVFQTKERKWKRWRRMSPQASVCGHRTT